LQKPGNLNRKGIFPVVVGDEFDLSVIYGQLYLLCCSNGKERLWHRSLHGKVTAEKCVQIGHAARLDLDRGRKNDPVGAFIRLEKIGSRVAPAKPGKTGNCDHAKGRS
jgi:hypothetical protein